jgi:hypothetical protein
MSFVTQAIWVPRRLPTTGRLASCRTALLWALWRWLDMQPLPFLFTGLRRRSTTRFR